MKNRYGFMVLIVSLALLINGCDITSKEETTDSSASTTIASSVTSETTEQTPTPTPVPSHSSATTEDMTDSDLDGIPDLLEIQMGTDPHNKDSDDDGLDDLIELSVGYNPLSPDTDGNGTSDIGEDIDGDELSNGDEIAMGTDMFMGDTDCDGLLDGDEVKVHGTDPLNLDSDDDGIRDGDGLSLGKDPRDPSDGDIAVDQTFVLNINNSDDPAITSVEVSASCPGNISDFLEVRDVYNIDFNVTGTLARVGSPIRFDGDTDHEGITVVIHYDENSLGETDENNLVIMWWCQDDDGISHYETQDQAVLDTDNNTLTFELQHYGSYIVADQVLWDNNMPRPYTVS